MRTDNEILARLKAISESDFFGFESQNLLISLPFDKVRPFLKADTKPENWTAVPRDRDDVLKHMREYMPFALEKASDHRGLSAGRSVNHFQSWTWLLGDEDYAAIGWENYAQYGVPILRQICERYGIQFPDDPCLRNMADGLRCTPDCDNGCGR